MSTIGCKRMAVILLIAVAVLLGCIWKLSWKFFNRRMEEQTAWNVIVDYENTRNRFSKMGVNDDISYLEVYARAGAGSFITDRSLNKIMEFEKKRMLKELIEDLRKKTGDDLGEDPNAWIKKYGSGSTNTTR